MWNLTKEAKIRFQQCNLLPIPETDEEWEAVIRDAEEEGEDIKQRLKEELEEVKEELLQVLPEKFIPNVLDGTLNQPTLPKAIRSDYLNWVREASEEFENILDLAHKQTEDAVAELPKAVKEVFEDSLHDSTIQRITWEDDVLHLYINTDGGFSTKAIIHLIFINVLTEMTDSPLEVGQWFIYDELQKTREGFAFRVLFESPEAEWTITMKKMDAVYYYRPSLYTKLRDEDKLEEISVNQYVSQLDTEPNYWLITPDVTCPIRSFENGISLENGEINFDSDEIEVVVEGERFTYGLETYEPISFIYSDVYEDPYASFNEALPIDELEEAALGDDLELQVRAWNTMYENPTELADVINPVLLKAEITEENEMAMGVYINHFYNEGILQDDVVEKYCRFIEM
ncbi:DUF4085 family protein [Ornithinibacillus halophilus]|uniref:DUF4085 family protein n=1 Tax=Ornithinibacillus halophilus TaxID=930117 RepID=A0A1M5FS70_9BACI|nr:DUF4085 family protein [Ornithinibacillus halophilus]SHF94365.1 Protein of unknown function [Ornithinibacillus halophilus]